MVQTVLSASFLFATGIAAVMLAVGYAQGSFETPAEALTWASELFSAAIEDLR